MSFLSFIQNHSFYAYSVITHAHTLSLSLSLSFNSEIQHEVKTERIFIDLDSSIDSNDAALPPHESFAHSQAHDTSAASDVSAVSKSTKSTKVKTPEQAGEDVVMARFSESGVSYQLSAFVSYHVEKLPTQSQHTSAVTTRSR